MQFDVYICLDDGGNALPACADALKLAADGICELDIGIYSCGPRQSTPPPEARGLSCLGAYGNIPKARNATSKQGTAPWLVFISERHRVTPGFFTRLLDGIGLHPQAGGFACRVLPGDLEQHIDPVTLEAPYITGLAVFHREAFSEAGGCDTHLAPGGEALDADLCWRIRGLGYRLYYLPHAAAQQEKLPETATTYAAQTLGPLLLSYKYGTLKQRFGAELHYLKTMRHPRHFPGVRRILGKQYLRHLATLWPLWLWRFGHSKARKNIPYVPGNQFAPKRGPSPLEAPFTDGPLISVVVRTHSRPDILRGALQSIANQTYPNYEVVVVEDGAPTARQMVEQEFGHLPLRYHATGENVGRGAAGNLGLSMAKGSYLNFLDDDDYFYPDHLELMAATAAAHPNADLVIGCAMAMMVDGDKPESHTAPNLYPVRFDRIDLFTLCQSCRFSIQSVLFKKSLYMEHGGLAENMGGHEDWAMWLRFFKSARRIHPRKIDIGRATSVFTQPANTLSQQARLAGYAQFDSMLFDDPNLSYTVTMAQMREFYDGMIDDIRHLHHTGQMEAFLEQQAHRGNLDSKEHFT